MPEWAHLVAFQRGLTALSSGYNLWVLARWAAQRGLAPRRRAAAAVLALVNLSFLLQALYPLLPLEGWWQAAAALPPLLASLAISSLLLGRGRG